MNRYQLNMAVRSWVEKYLPALGDETILSAVLRKRPDGGAEYAHWNIHVHGEERESRRRKIVLVAINSNGRNFEVVSVHAVPSRTMGRRKTAKWYTGEAPSWLDEHKVALPRERRLKV